MIGLDEFDMNLQGSEPPETRLKTWRGKFEGNILVTKDFLQFFEATSPSYLTIDQGTDQGTDLGKCVSYFCNFNKLTITVKVYFKETLFSGGDNKKDMSAVTACVSTYF